MTWQGKLRVVCLIAVATCVATVFLLGRPAGAFEGQGVLGLPVVPDFAAKVFVQVGGKKLTLREAVEQASSDRELNEYRRLRTARGATVAGQYELAKWCRSHGLEAKAQLHWRILLAFQPNHAAAIKQLGLRKYHGQLLTSEEIKQLKEKEKQYKQASKVWTPRLKKIRKAMKRGDASAREAATQELLAIDDPTAIPVIVELFSAEKPEIFLSVLRLLADMPGQAATEFLVQQVVLSDSPEVRQEAAYHLRQRDYHDYVPVLISGLAAPIEISSSVSKEKGEPIIQEFSQRFTSGRLVPFFYNKVRRDGNYTKKDVVAWTPEIWEVKGVGISGYRPDQYRLQYQLTRESSDPDAPFELDGQIKGSKKSFLKRANEFKKKIEEINVAAERQNRRIHEALTDATGADVLEKVQANEIEEAAGDPRYWRQWWRKQLDVNNYLAEGMEVWTEMGPVPVEQIMIGDRVLTRDPKSNELTFNLVVGLDIQPQEKMQMFEIDSRTIVATSDQVFYVPNEGRRKAFELKSGMELESLNGPRRITETGPGAAVATFALMIEGSSNYFVDRTGIQVADASPLEKRR